ncbi:pyrroline-5-carboxylate reductase [Pseudoflavonifractor sp. 524-17]|uniref:pyrroline-5-carboxylate reductase n=1 Tax=Pseudoflavonifractor sp. 524-17 TaxID=2304577 RepID=UPI00137B82F8|nr:pyrroline-5-carboxylate reductase [Pseudoflavonifractor sp. 524-17]NCE64045.1 pyrroline-5-carboxylate reductase [Pseudoflavonifractor sp. 524-17]
MKKAAFIGTGNMGGALLRAACQAIGADQVLAANHTPEKAEQLAAETGCTAVSSNQAAARGAQYLFLGVKPHKMEGVIREIAPELTQGQVLVSMAAGLTVDTLAGWAPKGVPILRIMPNTPCAIGKGTTALCAAPGTAEAHWAAVEEILRETGLVRRLEEGQMDAFSAVAGCGPAFVYLFVEALADGGVLAGLPRDQALAYAAQTAAGAAAMVLERGTHPGALKDAVCSPGGSTIQGVAALERGGLRAAVISAVEAAWRKNRDLGKT